MRSTVSERIGVMAGVRINSGCMDKTSSSDIPSSRATADGDSAFGIRLR